MKALSQFSCFFLLITGCFITLSSQQLVAQSISIQQPVVESFGVSTTVSVPDQGEVLLGSLKVAREGRKSFGPRIGFFPRGSSSGRELKQSSLSSRVTIQSHEEMDQALLNKPVGAPDLPFETSMREYRFSRFQHHVVASNPVNRHRRIYNFSSPSQALSANPSLKVNSVSHRVAQKYLQQAKQAEREGNQTLAKIYYRLAARNR